MPHEYGFLLEMIKKKVIKLIIFIKLIYLNMLKENTEFYFSGVNFTVCQIYFNKCNKSMTLYIRFG